MDRVITNSSGSTGAIDERACVRYLHPLPMNRFLVTSRKVSRSSCTITTIIVVNKLASRCRATGGSQTKQFLTTSCVECELWHVYNGFLKVILGHFQEIHYNEKLAS